MFMLRSMAWKNAGVLGETTGKIWSYFPELNPGFGGCSVLFLVSAFDIFFSHRLEKSGGEEQLDDPGRRFHTTCPTALSHEKVTPNNVLS